MELRGKRFLITGGASQLGSHVADQLLEAGADQIVLLDNFSLGSSVTIDHLMSNERVQLVRGDILRLNEVLDAATGIDGVFQVAGFLTLPLSQNPWVGLDVNVRGVQNVLEACRVRQVKKVVASSSAAVYGNAQEAEITEATPFVTQGQAPGGALYGASKIIVEQLCHLYHQRYGLDFVALRYCSIYGERQHSYGINAQLILGMYDRIRQGLPPVLSGDGSEIRDYVHVIDAARANLLAMQSDISGEAFNISNGEPRSLNQIARCVLDLCGSKLQPEYRTQPDGSSLTRVSQLCYSPKKAERLLGWRREIPLEEGIRRLIDWHEAHRSP